MDNEHNIVCLFAKTLVKVDKTAFYVSKGILCRIFYSTKFYFLETLDDTERNKIEFWQKCSVVLSKLLFTCPEDNFQESICLKTFCFFSLVFGFVKTLSAFCRKNPVRLPQLRFKWPEWSIEVFFFNRKFNF